MQTSPHICSGFNEFVTCVTKSKVTTLPPDSKKCFICVGKISIKTHLFYNPAKMRYMDFMEFHEEGSMNLPKTFSHNGMWKN